LPGAVWRERERERERESERVCVCVHSSVWAKAKGLGERQSQEETLGISSLDPGFLGRGFALPTYPRFREGPDFPS
jgi:hypothetical protein